MKSRNRFSRVSVSVIALLLGCAGDGPGGLPPGPVEPESEESSGMNHPGRLVVSGFAYRNEPLIFTWEFKESIDANFEIEICPKSGPRPCESFIKVECMARGTCEVIDGESDRYRANHRLNMQSVHQSMRRFEYEDLEYSGVMPHSYPRIRAYVSQQKGQWTAANEPL